MVGYGFNKYIRDKFRGWWMQYNYVLSAALDVGLALCSLAIFFFVQLPGGDMSSWWGTTIIESTVDAQQAAIRKTVAEGEIFGPKEWKW